jgi:hypothetical protein
MCEEVKHSVRQEVFGRKDLLRKEPHSDHPLAGQCYVASEALFHLTGGVEQWYVERTSVLVDGKWITHWYLRDRENLRVVDLTAEQFGDRKIPYGAGTRTGFFTQNPSESAQKVIDTIK